MNNTWRPNSSRTHLTVDTATVAAGALTKETSDSSFSFLRAAIVAIAIVVPQLATSQVYCLNGYAIVTVPANGYAFVVNQLDNPPNDLTHLVAAPVGAQAYLWDVSNQSWQLAVMDEFLGWYPNYPMPRGRGVILYSPTAYTNIFVGSICDGYYTNYVAGSNRFSLIGCPLPVGGPLSLKTNGPGFPRIDGAVMHQFRKDIQFFSDGYTCYTNYGWFDPNGIASTNGPIVGVGESFFVQNPGPPTNWITVFTNGTVFGATMVANGKTQLPIQSLVVQGGSLTIKISNPDGTRFDVWFTTDKEAWKVIATNQSGDHWTGPLPDPTRGLFQIVSSQSGGSAK